MDRFEAPILLLGHGLDAALTEVLVRVGGAREFPTALTLEVGRRMDMNFHL